MNTTSSQSDSIGNFEPVRDDIVSTEQTRTMCSSRCKLSERRWILGVYVLLVPDSAKYCDPSGPDRSKRSFSGPRPSKPRPPDEDEGIYGADHPHS